MELTSFEYRILEHLMLRAGEVISKTELTERLYEQDFDRDSNVVEVLIGRLRRKLDPDERHQTDRDPARPRLSPKPAASAGLSSRAADGARTAVGQPQTADRGGGAAAAVLRAHRSAIDYVFRQQTTAALRERLEEQVVALVTAVDLDLDGKLVVNLLDPGVATRCAGLGTVRRACASESGKVLWSSPSLAGTGLVLGGKLPIGGVDFRYELARDGTTVAELSRGLQWAYGSGLSKKLVFTVGDSTAPQMRELWLFRQRMAGWFGALALALLATMAWMMRRALAPVRRLEREIAALEGGGASLLGEGYPRELAGVTKGLNALLELRAQSHHALPRHARQSGA